MSKPEPIDAVHLRKIKKSRPTVKRPIYPLYTNIGIGEAYNFSNIRDSIEKWMSYSESVMNNWKQMMHLFHIVVESGTVEELNNVTSIIKENVMMDIDCPVLLKKDILRRYSESISDREKSSLSSIKETIDETIEADRVLNNIANLSKRFSIQKLINENILLEDCYYDTLYSLCSLIDTYQMDYKSKYCIATEAALYTIYESVDVNDIENESLRKKLSTESILETVLDYFVLNYGRGCSDKIGFINTLEETAHKDPFIGNQIDSYFVQLKTAIKESDEATESTSVNPVKSLYCNIDDMSQYDLIKEETDSLNQLVSIQEFSIDQYVKKAEEIATKIKLFPTQSYFYIKSIITALLVPCRAEDMAKGVHNMLSHLFYATIIIGALSLSLIGGIFTTIATLVVRKCIQKEYFKDTIQEYREHKYSIVRKIKDCKDLEKRRNMEIYLEQLDISLENLEKEYEKIRDRTARELEDISKKRISSPDYKPLNRDTVDPSSGKITPSSFVYDPNSSTSVKLNNTDKSTLEKHDDEDDYGDEEDDV